MSEVSKWLVGRLTLVIDNDQRSYNWVNDAVREALVSEGVTRAEYRAAYESGKTRQWADAVGTAVCDLITEWLDELPEGFLKMLITDAIPVGSSDVVYDMGLHYMPELWAADEWLDDEDEDEDDGGESDEGENDDHAY